MKLKGNHLTDKLPLEFNSKKKLACVIVAVLVIALIAIFSSIFNKAMGEDQGDPNVYGTKAYWAAKGVNATPFNPGVGTTVSGGVYSLDHNLDLINNNAGGCGFAVAENSEVTLILENDAVLNCVGGNASNPTGAGAGIFVASYFNIMS